MATASSPGSSGSASRASSRRRVAITNTHSVGVVRDALVAAEMRGRSDPTAYWSLPVVGETYDGTLNDINGMHVRPEHLFAALDGASTGPVPEGGVGGGTGMTCHGFKGGTGTASRIVNDWTVGALVQANYGRRERLTVDGVPVGREIPVTEVPSPWDEEDAPRRRARARDGLDHRDPRDRRTDAPPPARATRAARRPGHRPGGRRRGALERRPLPGVLHGEPRRASRATRPRPPPPRSRSR